jgi:xylem cysteine proteinase
MKVLALLLGVAYSALWEQERIADLSSIDHTGEFKNWMRTFNKTYGSAEEEARRFIIFLDTWHNINEHNIYDGEIWQMGHNQFSDLTPQEFEDTVLCAMDQDNPWGDLNLAPPVQDDGDDEPWTAGDIDWSNKDGKDWTTPIKNQGSCGSCWAFSTTGALESRAAIKSGSASNVVNLAEQELVDCDKGNGGCNGGWPSKAYKYIGGAGGLCLTSAYKYTAKAGSCKASSCGAHKDAVSKTSPSTSVTPDNAAALEKAVTAGPVSVCLAVSGWQSYKGGVFTGNCGTQMQHAVVAVGMGTASPGGDYWKVRNSWGASFGVKGYILLCRNCNKNGNQGQCGINHVPVTPNPV